MCHPPPSPCMLVAAATSPTVMAASGNGAIIFQWLERIGLGYSIPTFQAMGITNPHSLCTLTVEDYDAGVAR